MGTASEAVTKSTENSINLYLCGDTGPSGFGVATRGLLKHLLNEDSINLTCKTHFWGMNKKGWHFQGGDFPDKRFQEDLIKTGKVNDDYLIDDLRETPDRRNDLLENLGSNTEIDSEQCMVRDFEGEEDVWLAVGGMKFSEQAPKEPYTIVSTDYNLDIVPRDWEYYVNQIDEVWVPSEWTRQAVLNRLGDDYADRVLTMPYGIPMNYEPTEYDCEVCPHNSQQSGGGPPNRCLRDDAFNFLIISRFYHIKGMYRTVKAYIKEFRQDDDVRLFIKTTSNNQFQFNPVQSTQAIVQELGFANTPAQSTVPEIGFGTEPLETQYLYDLMGHCDAFLQISRAECFGIAQFQSAYCGTPVVYNDWSAQAELIDKNNDGFFPIEDYEVEKPRQENQYLAFEVSDNYPPDSQWATPSVEAIQKQLRELYEMDKNELESAGQEARKYVKENFRWEDMIQPRVERLKEVVNNE